MTRTIKASLLLFFLSLCVAALFVTHRVRAQVAAPAPHELFAIVEKQLLALRAADYSSAYRQASSGVQQKFTVPQFEAMVRRDYADMSAPYRVEFGSVNVNGSSAVVQVFFRSPNGSVRSFAYSFVAESDTWKINGVQEIPRALTRRPLTGLHI